MTKYLNVALILFFFLFIKVDTSWAINQNGLDRDQRNNLKSDLATSQPLETEYDPTIVQNRDARAILVGRKECPSTIDGVKIYSSVGKRGIKFYHFKLELRPDNTILPDDSYENSLNFKEYGQFQIFIPVKRFVLPSIVKKSKGSLILRTSQTLAGGGRSHPWIKEKQDLYFKIKKMVKSKVGSVELIVELPYDCQIETNIFVRDAGGKYIDYVGQHRE
ncbi:MAG: hypothetical protein ACN4E2_04880 [Nitrospinota bacterium]